jgi:hypothetical protein
MAQTDCTGRTAGMENNVKATSLTGRGGHADRGIIDPMPVIEARLCALAAGFP